MQVGRLSALKRYDKVTALTFRTNTPVPTASCRSPPLVVAIDALRARSIARINNTFYRLKNLIAGILTTCMYNNSLNFAAREKNLQDIIIIEMYKI